MAPKNREQGFGAHAMKTRSWKLIAHIDGLDGAPGWQEYFLVRETGQMEAVAALLRSRPDLASSRIEPRGEAGPDLIDWLQPDSDVFQIMVVS